MQMDIPCCKLIIKSIVSDFPDFPDFTRDQSPGESTAQSPGESTRAQSDSDNSCAFSYEKIRRLGKGTEGKVYLIRKIGHVQERGDNELFALKETFDDCRNEVALLHKIQNGSSLKGRANIVKCIHQLNSSAFIMDYTGNAPYKSTMDLYSYIDKYDCIQDKQLELLAVNILGGVRAMHQADVIHMDLKPENMMASLDKNQKLVKVTIVDFGFGKKNDQKLETACGTQKYAAPELLMIPFVSNASGALDLWAAAVTLMVADKCQFPFEVADSSVCNLFGEMFIAPHTHRFMDYSPVIVPHLQSMMRLTPGKRKLLDTVE